MKKKKKNKRKKKKKKKKKKKTPPPPPPHPKRKRKKTKHFECMKKCISSSWKCSKQWCFKNEDRKFGSCKVKTLIFTSGRRFGLKKIL